MKIVWSPLALERVEEMALYIAEDKPDVAEKWVEDLFAIVERLADFPESGRMVQEAGVRRIREVMFGTCRIVYSVGSQIDILTVRSSSQLLRLSELDDEGE